MKIYFFLQFKQKKDFSLLYIVCKEGNIENVECLLEIRVDVNLSDENGFIFFYIVCKCGYIYIL